MSHSDSQIVNLDLEPVQRVIHPFTGETLALESATVHDLASFLTELGNYKYRLAEATRAVQDEVLKRQDAQAKWTITTPDYVLKGSSPAPSEEFDELALMNDLNALIDEGLITAGAVNAAVETRVSYHVKRAGINALRKLGGRVEKTIDRHAREVSKTRYVRVTPNVK